MMFNELSFFGYNPDVYRNAFNAAAKASGAKGYFAIIGGKFYPGATHEFYTAPTVQAVIDTIHELNKNGGYTKKLEGIFTLHAPASTHDFSKIENSLSLHLNTEEQRRLQALYDYIGHRRQATASPARRTLWSKLFG